MNILSSNTSPSQSSSAPELRKDTTCKHSREHETACTTGTVDECTADIRLVSVDETVMQYGTHISWDGKQTNDMYYVTGKQSGITPSQGNLQHFRQIAAI